jgi:beta-lactam-binding protein with PASTA domain
MYEMLTSRLPFEGDSPVSVAIQHISSIPLMAAGDQSPRSPEPLELICMKAMAPDLEKRYASATDMLADLEEFRKNPNIVFDFTREQGDMDVDLLLNETNRPPEPRAQRPAAPRSAAERAAGQKKPAAPQPQQEQKSKSGRIAVIAGVICIALAVIGIGYFLYSYFFSGIFSKTAEDTVPKFIGMTYDQIDRAKYPNFTIEASQWKTSDTYPYGYVMDQTPEADTTAKVGTTIELTVSNGTETNKMPNLVNSSLASAQTALKDMNLVANITYAASDSVTDGYVISTDPAEGSTLKAGQTVTLVVSQGPTEQLVAVPGLVGEDIDLALQDIQSANLGKGDVRSVDSDLPEGTVTSQSIDEGEKVKAQTPINLEVSKGPQNASAPVISYLTGSSAVKVGDTLTLQIQASAADDGVLTYAWYVSNSGNSGDGQLVSGSAENNTTCPVDTSAAGTFYYYCEVVNTLGTAKATTESGMVKVTVEAKASDTLKNKVLYVKMPSADGTYDVTVKVGGVQQNSFEANMSDWGSDQISIQVSGSGTQTVDIYVNGELYSTQSIDFDTAG